MTYSLDLSQFSLHTFRQTLESGDLLPSRKALGEHVAERFAALEAAGITSLQDLIDALSTKKKLAAFAAQTGLPEDYLTLLRRQARSYIPTPANFADIPGVDPDHVARLAAHGITHTKHLFAHARTLADRESLADQTGIPADALLELVQLADIARAGWVGPVFARLLHAAGATTLAALAESDPEALYAGAVAVNEAQGLTRAAFTLKDVALTIDTARQLPHDVEYR